MSDADVSPNRLARMVGVSTKTAERWLKDPSRAPHPDTRTAVAKALGVDEGMLWPRAARSVVKTGASREIIQAYPYRNACPTSVWGQLIDSSAHCITFAGYTNYFIWQEQPRLVDRLAAKAASGCTVRFLVGDPESEVTRRREEIEGVPLTVSTRIRITLDALSKLKHIDGVDARFSDDHIALSVFSFDSEMLVTPHLSSLLGHESPMFQLHRMGDDGLYDRFAGHVSALWENGRPVWE
ncbi:hypothetical protein I1A49_16335 [Streptomyces malaysiensis subsp. malaysiensis]|uniref:XRE family transcriptional regulator n=2 Tax=Streptomyces TaxID=1883 RepID=A0ABX6W471_STRMQ|nr:hypothetical protein I1A49_16335 [Streptomyces solisilvae]